MLSHLRVEALGGHAPPRGPDHVTRLFSVATLTGARACMRVRSRVSGVIACPLWVGAFILGCLARGAQLRARG